ncbi:hypothetical protein CK477_22470 [Enterobacter cloacae]|nr:hypothetical protein CK477_22470 [Enterobacter cloacae]
MGAGDYSTVGQKDAAAALRFFRKAIRHHDEPEVLTIDKSDADTAALVILNAGKPDEETITVRQSKYLNNPAKENRHSQAVFVCVACGYEANADINGARNILAAGHAVLSGMNLGHAHKTA